MKHSKLLLMFFLTFSGSLIAQEYHPPYHFIFHVDYARFRNTEQSGYLEIYYGFLPQLLTFKQIDQKFYAGLKLWTRLANDESNEILFSQHVLLPVTLNDTTGASFRFPVTSQAGYAVPNGNYTLTVVAEDSLGEARRDSVSLPVVIRPYPQKTSCSNLELCSRIQTSEAKNNPFYKNRLEVVPNPILIFGVSTSPVLFHYLELYNLDPQATYQVTTAIINANNQVVRKSSRSKKYGVKDAMEIGVTNVTSIVSGRYLLKVTILDQQARVVTQAEKLFFIYNPHIQPPAPTSLTFQASVLDTLTDKEMSEEFLQAHYLATDEEIKMFEQLTTESGKREFLARFWAEVAKGRRELPPILRSEYLKRVKIADERFRTFSRDGWRTDRGRVYLLYGEPDDIDRFPSTSESKPYEIWYYHKLENGVQFVFIDRFGFGNYELVHSTKRGELWDEDWRRYLR